MFRFIEKLRRREADRAGSARERYARLVADIVQGIDRRHIDEAQAVLEAAGISHDALTSDVEFAREQVEIRRAVNLIPELQNREAALQQELAELGEHMDERIRRMRAEYAQLQQEINDITRRRDRAQSLAGTLGEAEERFAEFAPFLEHPLDS